MHLVQEALGWFGYLERGSVQAQLLLVVLPLLGLHLLRRRWRSRPPLAHLLLPLTLALIGLGIGLLAWAGQPYGLALFLLQLRSAWYGLDLLQLLLARLLPPAPLHQLQSRLIRPAFLVLAAMALINQLDSLADLALISIGTWFGVQLDLGQLFLSLVILYLVVVGSGPPAAALALLFKQVLDIDEGSRRAVQLLFRYLVVALGVVWVCSHLGLNATAILAIAGGLSVGLGFGIKEVFSNFVSGLWLLFEGSVRPGEVLFIDGDPCEVRSLGLRAAVLWRDRDNAELVIPNQTFFTSTTTTYTGSDRMRRSQVSVGAAYRHDPEQVVALLEATARAQTRVLPFPPPKALVLGYGESSINYALRFWIANPMDNVSICSEVNMAVWKAFDAAGIEIPFPQMVVKTIEPASPVSVPPSAPDQ
ncbi:mechanosensitive ion channel family protein [Synechococcus sp. CS-1328]|uniref:mechanosensitive ion channel family protein n=1 Tax=Synechococcus sp. CS-1328 TaxID=2847976 RepID=UPI00223A864B|nr:mechanosensitive ion channel domain-containing protein [Synechococcus sp. CS-1328]